MNALIHSFDRIEPPERRSRSPNFIQAVWARAAATIHQWRVRRAMVALREWDDHMLRDIGLTRDDVRALTERPLSDGRWMVQHGQPRDRG